MLKWDGDKATREEVPGQQRDSTLPKPSPPKVFSANHWPTIINFHSFKHTNNCCLHHFTTQQPCPAL